VRTTIIGGKVYADDGDNGWVDYAARAEYSANQIATVERELKFLREERREHIDRDVPKKFAEINAEIEGARQYIGILKRAHKRLVLLRDKAIEASKR
jgi:hypothetical protein